MKRIGDILLAEGKISDIQLNEALNKQKLSHQNLRLGEVLLDLGYVNETDILDALSKSLNYPVVDFTKFKISMETIKKVPKSIAIEHVLVPIAVKDNKLQIVMMDPLDYYALEDIKSIVNMPITILIGLKTDILTVIELSYKELEARQVAKKISDLDTNDTFDIPDIMINESDSPIVTLINSVLLKAESINASDIHIEPFETYVSVRLRVDGQLLDYTTLPISTELQLSNRVKVLSNLNIAERRLPQDGHFKQKIEGIVFNVRVSILPTMFGEKIVLRLLNKRLELNNESLFGMNIYNYEKVLKILENPYGLVYLTGPTGSGKTTTLYLLLKYLRRQAINISTIEDPVEEHLEKINQTQINLASGLTFSRGLRSLLRQDPDILMVGETRDIETAQISVSAAITGHLVLSTLHTNDAISSIIRLEDMGIEPYMVGNSLVGVVAQRLAKKVCEHCKEEYILPDYEKIITGLDYGYKGKGCLSCNGTGYKGRIAVHEVLVLNTDLKNMISTKCDIQEIYKYLENSEYKTLKDNLIEYIKQGITTVNELLRLSCNLDN